MEILNILKIIYFEDTPIASVGRGFKIASPDFSYSKRILIGFPVLKSYLIKSKTKYNFNKRLGKNNFQFFYYVWLLKKRLAIIPSSAPQDSFVENLLKVMRLKS